MSIKIKGMTIINCGAGIVAGEGIQIEIEDYHGEGNRINILTGNRETIEAALKSIELSTFEIERLKQDVGHIDDKTQRMEAIQKSSVFLMIAKRFPDAVALAANLATILGSLPK